MRVAFYTLGCKLNFSETSTLARQTRTAGHEVVPFEAGADCYVINTCSVTEHADLKCRKVVEQARKLNPKAQAIITGCYAQLKPEAILNIPGVALVLGAAEKFEILKYLDSVANALVHHFDTPAKAHVAPIAHVNTFVPTHSEGDRTRTFLKVQDGCDYTCTFCTIPQARGASRSSTIQSVVQRVHALEASGTREIVLTGINLGDYGRIPGERGKPNGNFFELLQALDTQTSIPRIRISSIEPNLLEPEIIDYVASSRAVMPHFHIPLQSGSNEILAQMRRRYQRELYAERVEYIKKTMPHASIGVDVIVGFPGETEAQFLDTYQFLNELEVSYFHVFTYSERANTPAATLPNRLPERIRQERNTQLSQLSNKKRDAFYRAYQGSTRPVLFEGTQKNGQDHLHGFTDNYIKIEIPYDPLMVNEIVEVRIGQSSGNGLASGYIPEESLAH
jgi:threonylcarbamoyladenosine tRNA methylthiotransferase MtaB